jgi:hypothetical protein
VSAKSFLTSLLAHATEASATRLAGAVTVRVDGLGTVRVVVPSRP